MDNAKDKALNRALKYLGYKMRTKNEVYEYLLRKNFSEEDVLYAVQRLEELKYLDDSEYANFWIKDRFNFFNQGKYKIRQDLLKKGIEKDLVDNKIDDFFTEELEYKKIQELYFKKRKNKEKLSQKEYASIYNFLIRRGFTANLVGRVLRENKQSNL